MTRTAIGLPRESRSYSPCATHAREDRPARRTLRFSRFAELIPRRRIGLSRFLDLFPKVGKTTRPVGHSSPCTSDLYRRRVRLSRLSPSAGPGRARSGRAGPGRTGPHLAVRPGRVAPGRATPGSYRRPAGLRNASSGKASAPTTGPGFGMRPAAGLRNATRLRRTRPGQVSARRLLN